MHVKDFYENMNHISGDRLRILQTAIQTFTEKQAGQASAGLAYYTFFSIFPLMLAFIAGGSYFLDSHQVFNTVTQFIQQALPISRQVINENLEEILQERGGGGSCKFSDPALVGVWNVHQSCVQYQPGLAACQAAQLFAEPAGRLMDDRGPDRLDRSFHRSQLAVSPSPFHRL